MNDSNLFKKSRKKTVWSITIILVVILCILIAMHLLFPKNAVATATNPLSTFCEFLEQNSYFEYTYTNGTAKRYYKTYHNIITSEFYDVVYDENDNIKKILKSKDTITEDEIPENSWTLFSQELDPNLQFPVLENEQIINTEYTDMYVKINNEVVPVRIIECTYENEASFQYLKTFCYNLLDGSPIDYYSQIIKH